MKKHCIGIDVDKKTFKACLIAQNSEMSKKIRGSKRFSNQKEGFYEFSDWIKNGCIVAILNVWKHILHCSLKTVQEGLSVYKHY